MDTTSGKLEHALRVLVTDRKIHRFLRDHDPKALAQAEEALGLGPTDGAAEKRLHTAIRRKLRGIGADLESAHEALDGLRYEEIVDELETASDSIEAVRDLVGDMLHARAKGATA